MGEPEGFGTDMIRAKDQARVVELEAENAKLKEALSLIRVVARSANDLSPCKAYRVIRDKADAALEGADDE